MAAGYKRENSYSGLVTKDSNIIYKYKSFDPDARGNLMEHDGLSRYILPNGESFGEYIIRKGFVGSHELPKGMSGSTYMIDFKTEKNVLKHITNPMVFRETLREIGFLRMVKGKWYAVQLLAAQINPDGSAFMLFPYIPGQELYEYLHKLYTKSVLTPEDINHIKDVFKTIIDGLKELHSLGIIHRDIKPENIWIPDDQRIKPFMIDFGLSAKTTEYRITAGTKFYTRSKRLRELRKPTPNDNYYAVSIIMQYMLPILGEDIVRTLERNGITNVEANAAASIFLKRRRRYTNKSRKK